MDKRSEKAAPNCPFNNLKIKDAKNAAEIVGNWYKSVYFWNLAYHQAHMSYQSAILVQRSAQAAAAVDSAQATPQSENEEQQAPELYKIPSLARRFFAEAFDGIYVQVFKIFVIVLIMNNTNLIDEDAFNFFDFIENLLSEENFRLPVEIFILEVVYISISFFFESFCIYKYGCTPGKFLFKLKVISCVNVNEHPNSLVQILPGTKPSLKHVCLRTILKNFSMLFLFPTIIFFLMPAFMEHGQTSYDKASESIVVQKV